MNVLTIAAAVGVICECPNNSSSSGVICECPEMKQHTEWKRPWRMYVKHTGKTHRPG